MAKASPAPIKYVGSKSRLTPMITSLIGPHHCYVEVFGGSGVVLFSKSKSPVEVYNDLNNNLVALFRVLRDQAGDLQKLLELTLYSRSEWEEAAGILRNGAGVADLKIAWAAFVVYNQSMGGAFTQGRGGWGFGKVRDATGDYFSRLPFIKNMQNRLHGVMIENRDFRDIIRDYDTPETFFYLDPPYVKETRSEPSAYFHEMTELDHIDLVEMLCNIRGKMALSGYNHPVYKPLDKHYRKVIIPIKSQLRADGVIVDREEIIWTSTDNYQLTF
jgi:DNA adenine methylase